MLNVVLIGKFSLTKMMVTNLGIRSPLWNSLNGIHREKEASGNRQRPNDHETEMTISRIGTGGLMLVT